MKMNNKLRASELAFKHKCQNCGASGTAHGTLWGEPVVILKVAYCDRCQHSYFGVDGMGGNASPAILQLVGHLLSQVPPAQRPEIH